MLNKKVKYIVDKKAKQAEATGFSKIATCWEWDSDIWTSRKEIIRYLKEKGLLINSNSGYGVLDIYIRKRKN